MANAPSLQSTPEGKGHGKGNAKDARFRRNGNGKSEMPNRGGKNSIRRPVLAMCKVHDRRQAEEPARQLKAALLEAEAGQESVDGGLLGMAAAHSARLGLNDVVDALCVYAWSRLFECQGREVAEMAAAASRCGSNTGRFFQFVVVYCGSMPERFSCLRDVALLAAALITQSSSSTLDLVVAFEGLSKVAKKHLSGESQNSVRDISEFFYALAAALGTQPSHGGPGLSQNAVVADVLMAISVALKPLLHKASAQDIAKAIGGASGAWVHMPHLQAQVLTPLMQELSVAVRFRSTDFNMQDLSQILVAFAKVDSVEGLSLSVLEEQIAANISAFKPKDLSLTLWAIARPNVIDSSCTGVAIEEVLKRDLTQFSVQDLCMSAQALVKMGAQANPALCLVAGEVFARQVEGFSVTDKVLLLWVLAKSKVVHIALSRLLVKELAVDCGSLARDRISLALWSLAVLWQNLQTSEPWPRLLASSLLASQPWQSAPAHEVTNAAWAFRQLPPEIVAGSWDSLLQAMMWLHPPSLPSHELCNLVAGLVVCPSDASMVSCVLTGIGAEVVHRSDFSSHDKGLLGSSLSDESVQKRLQALGLQNLIDLCRNWAPYGKPQLAKESRRAEAERRRARARDLQLQEQEEQTKLLQEQPEDIEVPPPPTDGTWRHMAGSNCTQNCCTPLSDLSMMRLNSHCDFNGHCVQLKHTFIHIDCSNSDSEDDCMLCNISRQRQRPRARSMDSKGPGEASASTHNKMTGGLVLEKCATASGFELDDEGDEANGATATSTFQ